MKSSIFNVFVPAKKGYCIYNTMTESTLFCDEELKNALETNKLDALKKEYIPILKKYGILVDDTADELNKYVYHYNARLFNTKEIQLVAVTTYTCNLACPYCYEGKGEVYSQDMDIEMATTVAKAMQHVILQMYSQYVTVILFGGEPLVNLDTGLHLAKTMREWCGEHNRALRIFMTTNGTLLTKEKASELAALIDGVHITLDGSQPFHDTLRIYKNGKGTYNDIKSAITNALDAGMRVSLRIQVSKENWRSLGDLFQDIKPFIDTGKVHFNIAPLSRYSGMCSSFSSHFLEEEEQKTVLPAVIQYNRTIKPVPNFLPCIAYTNNIIFDGGGNVYRCITTVGEERRLGHLEGETIVWEPESYAFLGRNPLKIPGCKTCAYLPLCGGGCARTAFLTHNTYESSVCGGSKAVYTEVVTQYVQKQFPDRF